MAQKAIQNVRKWLLIDCDVALTLVVLMGYGFVLHDNPADTVCSRWLGLQLTQTVHMLNLPRFGASDIY